MAGHSWEQPPVKRFAHSWENRPGPDPDDDFDAGQWGMPSDSDSEGEDKDTPGHLLVRKILHMHLLNKITAEDCCTTLFFAAEAGVVEARQYAKAPGSSSGKYAERLRKLLGHLNNDDLYYFEYPGHHKHALSRMTHTGVCLPPHEQLWSDLATSVGYRTRLGEMVRRKELPDVYFKHQVVQQNSDMVLPVAMYIDAVPYSQTDSVIGWWMIDLVSERRYLWAVLRKQHSCRCGCRGWDSCYIFLKVLCWSLRCLADGCYPSARHDGQPFLETDTKRLALAGQAAPIKVACLFIKGDWSEFATTLGLPSWCDGIRPCFLCNAFGLDLFVAAGHSDTALRWRDNEDEDYNLSCERCLNAVQVATLDVRNKIATLLKYDKSKEGSCGRSLKTNLLEHGLCTGDRLEPSDSLPDVGQFETAPVPFVAYFWRRSEESHSRRPNPLFRSGLGVSPCGSLAIDTLHAFYLGVMRVWAKIAIWRVLLSGVFGDSLPVAILAMRSTLMTFYKIRHAEFQQEGLTRLADFSAKTVGTKGHQTLKSKGAETFGLLKFLLYLFPRYGERLGPHWQRLLKAGQCLDRIVEIWHSNGWTIPAEQRKESIAMYCQHIAMMSVFSCFTPKHHLVFHLLFRQGAQGNPAKYSTWLDESLNKVLKQACKNACSAKFDQSILLRMRELLRTSPRLVQAS